MTAGIHVDDGTPQADVGTADDVLDAEIADSTTTLNIVLGEAWTLTRKFTVRHLADNQAALMGAARRVRAYEVVSDRRLEVVGEFVKLQAASDRVVFTRIGAGAATVTSFITAAVLLYQVIVDYSAFRFFSALLLLTYGLFSFYINAEADINLRTLLVAESIVKLAKGQPQGNQSIPLPTETSHIDFLDRRQNRYIQHLMGVTLLFLLILAVLSFLFQK